MPFWKTVTLTITGGESAYPADYLQQDAMLDSSGVDRIRYASNERWYSTVQSRIDSVATNPIYKLSDTGFVFAPNTLTSATLEYISNPTEIVWAFTLDVNNRPVYDAGNSVDPLWRNTDMYEVISRLLAMTGVNLQSAAIAQHAQTIKTQGQ